MFESILVVCTGNICRSPIAERLLRQLLPDKKIDSAGVGAMVDKCADPSALRVAEKHGLSLADHKGVQFTGSLGRQYQLILVMEKEHLEHVTRIAPEAREGANKQVISSQADSLIKISRIWADFFPANTSNQPI